MIALANAAILPGKFLIKFTNVVAQPSWLVGRLEHKVGRNEHSGWQRNDHGVEWLLPCPYPQLIPAWRLSASEVVL